MAASHAEQVDRDGAFPQAAIDAAKRERFFSLLVPRAFGGEGASVSAVADVCYGLGRACASSAMIVAMHQASLACIVRHHGGGAFHTDLLRRVAAEQLLLASSTTEGANGGNVRSSEAALAVADGRLHFDRAATVMSYGAQADGIVSVARRAANASASDQQLVVLLKNDYSLEPTGGWDTLGMRGTCSAGFALVAEGSPEQVLPVAYKRIHPLTMVPISHLTWAALWAGIAAAAVERARMFVRAASRQAGGKLPPGAAMVTRADAALRGLRGTIAAALAGYEAMADDERALASMDAQAGLALFKVDASERAVETVMLALRASGLAGYRNDGPFGLGRHLRDVLSAPIMVHNERILANMASAALVGGVPASLLG